ncbi:uncharacterized protein EV420DRAFT_1129024 [Desarmillaria tabescens]|uniref:Uncharacterized protein n=1 Tax=Armillaria tabescens TaxID=1929756 RepID=A0AA39MPD5_ARMTA|nr:uncharacterized protein EV420DRAFT_1129024 [Desarmillaria tabescens]KAK0440870.1 hypothetical protein EV420DRAFT_1129024 [Desarmillaria tabescens]
MAMLEGPPSLRWLLNPVSTTGASLAPSFQTESRVSSEIEILVRDDTSEWMFSRDSSALRIGARHPLPPRDDNSGFDRIQVPSYTTFDPQSVSHNNKRRFHEIDDRNCRVSDGSSELAAQPKPVFYKNKTAMRAPPKPKLQQQHYYSAVSGAPVQPTLKDIYGNDGSMQYPYTGCPRAFDIFTQYDEMKIHLRRSTQIERLKWPSSGMFLTSSSKM